MAIKLIKPTRDWNVTYLENSPSNFFESVELNPKKLPPFSITNTFDYFRLTTNFRLTILTTTLIHTITIIFNITSSIQYFQSKKLIELTTVGLPTNNSST
jgi:hypothetical protein